LFIRDIDLLNQEDQRWIAQAITEQVQLVATTKPEAILEPTLARHTSTGTVPLPPLRQRRDDTMAWFRYFVDTFDVSRHVKPPTLSDPAEAVIRGYLWPGNLHELKQRAERACALVDDTVIRPEHLGLYSNTEPTVTPLEEATANFKRKYVQQVLDQCGGNRTLAARLLCVDPRTIFRFLENQRKG
jgi:two-component system response regulator HydG